MKLTGKQIQELQEALLSAFPTRSELEKMVRFQLEKNLSEIAGGENLADLVFNLITKWAEPHGKVEELVRGAYEQRPNNNKIKSFFKKIIEIRQGGSNSLSIFINQHQLYNFTGRKTQPAKLLAALQLGQVVTLCGPGGIGKSALAAEVIRRLTKLTADNTQPNPFPDGIIFHEFYKEPLASQALDKIAHTFGGRSGQSTPEMVSHILSDKKVLLLLDGAEKADDLEKVINVRGNECGVLITTRDRKQVDGERLDIEPLPTNEAVTLLRKWGGKWAVDEMASQAICKLVGGLPLAVRLIGRYLNSGNQKTVEYLKWLQKTPLKALDQGQRQLESVPILLDKSLQEVSKEAREALAVVGLLALAPFSSEIVAHVLGMESFEAGPLLAELVRYGFLMRKDDPYEVSHALIYTYARERLAGTIERKAKAEQRFINYYFQLAQNATPSEQGTFPAIEQDYPHILKALEKAKEQYDQKGDTARQLMIDFVEAVDRHWQVHSQYDTQVSWLNEAYECAEVLGESIPQASFAQRIGRALSELGELEQALSWMTKGKEDLKDIEGRKANSVRALIHIHRASALYLQNNLPEAKNDCILGLKLADEHRQGASVAEACNLLGSIYGRSGEYDKAITFMDRSLRVWRKLGHEYQAMRVQGNMGTAYLFLGQLDKACQAYQSAQEYWHSFPNPSEEAIMLNNLSVTSCTLGQCQAMAGFLKDSVIKHYQEAQNYSNESLIIGQKLNQKRLLILSLRALAWAQIYLGNSDKAKANLNKSLEIQHGSQIDIYLADTYYTLAEVAIEEKRYNQAIKLANDALKEIGDQGDESEKGAAHRVLGKAYRLSGKLDLAQKELDNSLMVLKEITTPFETALTWRELVFLYELQGREEEAQEARDEMRKLLVQMEIIEVEKEEDEAEGDEV